MDNKVIIFLILVIIGLSAITVLNNIQHTNIESGNQIINNHVKYNSFVEQV